MKIAAGAETRNDRAQESAAAKQPEQKSEAEKIVETGDAPECPDCGAMLVLQEGCRKCSKCGWSKC
jgi:ribonucleoside-diphosphate reductase alpha chain